MKQEYQIRTMLESDLAACQTLKEQLIWNQTLSDWQRFLSYNPNGCFVAERNRAVVGTACTIAYEDKFGWVAMVIVVNGKPPVKLRLSMTPEPKSQYAT